MPAQSVSSFSAIDSVDNSSYVEDDSGDTARPMDDNFGIQTPLVETVSANTLPRKPTEADFKDVLTPGADFADVEGDEFSGDVSPSNDSLGGG